MSQFIAEVLVRKTFMHKKRNMLIVKRIMLINYQYFYFFSSVVGTESYFDLT